jgi:hypothetical protein
MDPGFSRTKQQMELSGMTSDSLPSSKYPLSWMTELVIADNGYLLFAQRIGNPLVIRINIYKKYVDSRLASRRVKRTWRE